jgi:capsular polysaccharide biosynthesis protein
MSPYAHWLLEALPRLALIQEFPTETRILVPPHRVRYQVESLNLIGLLERSRWTKENHIMVEDYYFSAQPTMITCYSPYAVNFLRSSFLALGGGDLTGEPRVFVRRTSYWRNMVNEEEVLSFFQAKGWSVVDTAIIGFQEQIRLFAQAEAVCGIHGSGLANIVWCQPGCKVIELFADRYLGSEHEWISQCIRANYYPMVFPSDYKLSAVVDLDQVRRLLLSLRLI